MLAILFPHMAINAQMHDFCNECSTEVVSADFAKADVVETTQI